MLCFCSLLARSLLCSPPCAPSLNTRLLAALAPWEGLCYCQLHMQVACWQALSPLRHIPPLYYALHQFGGLVLSPVLPSFLGSI